MDVTRILVRYGEIFLKGNNRCRFEQALLRNIKALAGIGGRSIRGRIVLPYFKEHTLLRRVFGIVSYSLAFDVEKDIAKIEQRAIQVLACSEGTFRIETRRSDKSFPLTSPETNARVGRAVEQHLGRKVSVVHPEVTLHIEIHRDRVYVFTERVSCFGGIPTGVEGKAIVLVEDNASILAGLLMMKRGCDVIPIMIGEGRNISLLQSFSPKKIKIISLKHKSELGQYLLQHQIPLLVTGENFEQRKESLAEAITFRPLIAYTPERISEEMEIFRKITIS